MTTSRRRPRRRETLVASAGVLAGREAAGMAEIAAAAGPPDDAFIAPGGHAIIATQEMHDTVSVINIATRHITRRYGHPGVPGSAPGYFSHPDDAMLLPGATCWWQTS